LKPSLAKIFNLFSVKDQSCEIIAAMIGTTCLLTVNRRSEDLEETRIDWGLVIIENWSRSL